LIQLIGVLNQGISDIIGILVVQI